MSDTLSTILTIVFSSGGALVVAAFWKGLRSFTSGRAAEERTRIQTLVRERDSADAHRRVISEYASTLRGLMNEHGLGHLVPEWPPNPAASDPNATRRSRRND